MAKNKRSRKLVRYDLQLKVVFITLFVASLVLLINFQLSLAALWSLSSKLTANTNVMVAFDELRRAIINKFLISVGMAIPLAAAVGILYSFKFCGPLYRFKVFLSSLHDGRWDARCRLRKGDDLQDICDVINSTIDTMGGAVIERQELLEEVRALHASGALSASGESAAQLQSVVERVASASETFAQRFPGRTAGAADAAVQVQTPAANEETCEEREEATTRA